VTQPETETAADVAETYSADMRAVVRNDPRPAFWRAGKFLVAIVTVLLLAALAVALAVRNDQPVQHPRALPSATGHAASAAPRSDAVTWLQQNTAAGTRLLVPPELVDEFAAGLPGRQVLANDDTAARNGDLLVVTPNSGDVLVGTLTEQVLAAAPVVARLPGSDLDVHQVSGPDPSGVAARASAGTELLQNLGLSFVAGSSPALRSGQVDERVLVILAGLASQHSLTVALVHDPADAPEAPVRTLQIEGVDGHRVTNSNAREITDFVTAQRGALAGPVVDQTSDASTRAISIRYPLPVSVDLLRSGSLPTVPQGSP
jgi:hypothetical protein